MLFHSQEFAIFFPVVFLLYLTQSHIWQNRMLLVASYIFYAGWDWRYLSLILISTSVDFFCGLRLEATEQKQARKRYLCFSILTNLSLLCTFKYYDFFAVNFQNLFGRFGVEVDPFLLGVALPVAISFYTFQTMSYTIDVYRRQLPACRNYFDFALYVAYFPQLIAGPIERGTRLLPQILAERKVTLEQVQQGVYFFLWGLFLKVVLADNLAKMVDPVFNAAAYKGSDVLMAVYAFSFQIYCDFAGYTFMAIGLARCMGIELMENFRRPYFSRNISEFWRRWHISLSTWFRDYVFSPFYVYLSNRKPFCDLSLKLRHGFAFFFALLATEYLLGFWHGAGWNFGFFGIYHALAIWVYYIFQKNWDRMPVIIQIFLMYQVACGGWFVFRANSLEQAWEMSQAVLFNFQWSMNNTINAISLLGYICVLITVQIFQELKNDTLVVFRMPAILRYSYYIFLAGLIFIFGDFGEYSYIYFQF